jgi:hypothetical protein
MTRHHHNISQHPHNSIDDIEGVQNLVTSFFPRQNRITPNFVVFVIAASVSCGVPERIVYGEILLDEQQSTSSKQMQYDYLQLGSGPEAFMARIFREKSTIVRI